MILSLCIYIILAASLWVLAEDQQACRLKVGNRFFTWQNITAILLFSIIYGVRYNVGVDNLTYIKIYEALENGNNIRASLEPGYAFLQQLFISGGLHYSVFIGLWGALQIGFVYYAVRQNKYLLPYIALFIVLGPIWLKWANIMRQTVVECVFIFLIEFIDKKKIFKYIIGVLLCMLIHKTAILLLPFYFILQKTIFPKNKWIATCCVITCTLIGFTPLWIKSMTFIESVLSFLDYDSYVINYDAIINEQDNFRMWGPSRAGLWFLYLLTVWSYLYFRERLNFEKKFDIYFECFFYGTCLYELFANVNPIFIRPLSYFQSTAIIIVPFCLYYAWKTKRRILYSILCLLAFFNTFWWTIKAYIGTGLRDQAPEVYKFFFLQ